MDEAVNVWKQAAPPLVVSLVTTHDGEGNVNASPKTWWTPTSYEPPRLVLAVKPDSDTHLNIEKTGLFALHLPPTIDWQLTQKVFHTAKKLEYGKNELDDVGLAWNWSEHPVASNLKFAAVEGMPWFGCMVHTKYESGDHTVYEGQIVQAAIAREGEEQKVQSVLLHRGLNKFVSVGGDYTVERY